MKPEMGWPPIPPCWAEATPPRRAVLAGIATCAVFLLFLALRHVWRHPDALVYLPAYLIFIYLFHQSWMMAICERSKERLFVALGLSFSVLRYPLLFTSLEPYLDVLTVLTFYFFAYSQALLLEESRRLIRALNAAGALSVAFYLLMVLDYWVFVSLGPRPYLLDRLQLETRVGPVWLLASVGAFIGFLFDFHLRAALETDDFAIRLRLGFLLLSWPLLMAFFVLDEGVHFGWVRPHQELSDFLLVLSILFVQLGLAMPRPVEKFFSSLYFLDRHTSRELTLFVLTRLVRHSTGSALTELAMATAEQLGIDRRERQQIFLACEFLAAEDQAEGAGEDGNFVSSERDWEELIVTSAPEGRRLALHQQTVFKAWRLKRAVMQGARPNRPARLIAACRDYLLGGDPAEHDPDLWRAVETAAAVLRARGAGEGEWAAPEGGEGLKRVSMRMERKGGDSAGQGR